MGLQPFSFLLTVLTLLTFTIFLSEPKATRNQTTATTYAQQRAENKSTPPLTHPSSASFSTETLIVNGLQRDSISVVTPHGLRTTCAWQNRATPATRRRQKERRHGPETPKHHPGDHGISPVLSENSSSHHVALSTCSLVSKDSQHHHRVVHCPTPQHDLYKERHRPAQPRTTCRKEKKTLFFSLKTEQNLHAYEPPTPCTDAAPISQLPRSTAVSSLHETSPSLHANDRHAS
ncbi:hypothetical protein I3843_10G122500 [Carya illinoinensis]|nr:hypothetical protein I3843_10G122500 [Carya illinoinensis]KAG7960424.1 hypothetical protein I3843_10G122500 [Carya illinoinensis]